MLARRLLFVRCNKIFSKIIEFSFDSRDEKIKLYGK